MPSNPATLERQMAPQRAYLVSANTEPAPEAAHAASDFLADPEEPPTPGGWLRRMAGRLVLMLALVAAIVLICFSPLLPRQ